MTQSPTFPKPGDRIGQKYRIEGVLGRGGMGAVFDARHEITHKRFAIKVLLPEVDHFDEVVKRFIREAQVAGRFQHPNVVEVYDIGQDGNWLFMVMELLTGETLSARLKRQSRLNVAEACHILLPCLDGIAAAHAVGIIHRDIKPANIFLCPAHGRAGEHPKVLDFGISKLNAMPGVPEATKTDTGTVMGTPYYMAPEQLRALRLDERVDVYSLGVTLYEMLTGRHPFEATSYPELVLKIAGDTPVPVEARVSDVPAGVGAVVRRAMARNRNDRYASVVEMARALALFANASDRAVAQFASASDPSRFSAPATSSNRARSAASGSAGARGPWFATTQRTSTPFASESVSGSRRPQPLLGRVSVRVLGAAAMLLFGLTALALWWRPDERRPEQRPPPSPSTTTAAASAPPRDTTSPTFVPIPSAAALKPAEPVIAQPPPSAASKAIATEPPPPRRHRARSLPPPAAVSNAPPEVVAPAPRAIDDKPHGRPRPSLGRADF